MEISNEDAKKLELSHTQRKEEIRWRNHHISNGVA